MTSIRKALIVTALIAAVGTGIYEAHRASQLQQLAQALLLQQDSLTTQLRHESKEAANELAAARQPGNQSLNDQAELRKLRAEAARLRGAARELAQVKADAASQSQDPAELAMRSLVDRVKKLQEKLGQMPDQRIPEFQFLSDQDWFNAVKNIGQPETDADIAHALTALRTSAKDEFANIVQSALRGYAQANNGQSPAEMSQLQPYFTSSVDGSVLQRYQLTQPGTVTELATPLDDQDGKYYQISMNTINSSSRDEDILQPAADAYSAANNGQAPSDPAQLLPYATTPTEQAALQKLIQHPAGR
jgi:hypothetical protein